MSNGDLGWITNFIWGIADDVLRDLYVRGKYRDVILPMTVLRRLDAVSCRPRQPQGRQKCRIEHQTGLRRYSRRHGSLHSLFLQAAAPAHTRGDPRRYPGAGRGNQGADGRDHRCRTMMEATVTRHSNIPWLRGLPEHWKVVSSKRLFCVRKELARSDDEQLAATQAYGVIPQKEYERRVGRRVVRITQNLEKRRHVERDDFVISMRSFEGGLERAWATGCIRSSYVVLKPRSEVDVNFFQYLFKSPHYIQALRATSNFIRDGQDLNISNFSLVDLPLPPIAEQGLIARYLHNVDGRIRQYLRAKKKIIALLNEQKQAIIHRAVTRGIDPNVKLKPSGISWLGDVPAHWEVKRLRNVANLRVSNIDKKTLEKELAVRLCNYVDVYKNDPCLSG